MADIWTTPASFTTSEVVTAAKMNQYVRDNFDSLQRGVVGDLSSDVDIRHLHKAGTFASLPTFSASDIGRFYYTTDLGAMFFNDGTRWMPVWGNPRVCDYFYDEFIFNPLTFAPWQDSTSGGTVTTNISTRYGSTLSMQTGVGASSLSAISLPHALAGLWSKTRAPALVEVRAAISSASRINESVIMGLVGASSTGVGVDPDDGIFFRKRDTGTEQDWFGVCRRSGVETLTSAITGIKDANMHNFQFRVNAAGTSVEFFVDDVSKGSVSANIPGQDTTDECHIELHISESVSVNKILTPEHFIYIAGGKPA